MPRQSDQPLELEVKQRKGKSKAAAIQSFPIVLLLDKKNDLYLPLESVRSTIIVGADHSNIRNKYFKSNIARLANSTVRRHTSSLFKHGSTMKQPK